MPIQISLNNRQQQVLGATVRQYIATARPVGSEALVDGFQPRVSPATIRNVMGYLEKAGLLYQPHTSAGRVPSDSGYRVYVDQLIIPSEQLAKQADRLLSNRLDVEGWTVEAMLHGAAQILSTLSGYISLVTMPLVSKAVLRHLQLVQTDPSRVMLIVVLDSYETHSTLFDLPPVPSGESADAELLDRELQILSNFLTQHLKGRSLGDIATLDWSDLGRKFDRYADLLQDSLLDLNQRTKSTVSSQMFITGVAEVMKRQPEFSEIQQVQTLMQLLESEREQLWSLIFDSTELEAGERRVTVRIGAENPLEPMKTCTLVSATYQRGSATFGSVSMLGPTRMVYENAIALVEATADYLSEALS
ncbi:heat-inducible transcriptional repressor HrcA [Leptolyngbya sp. AN02str]|uniref:heat-inducible transcriptional repressor HrcA n=1 Tax=Leptolyngbya sp. AN02str TaxID=3423363 RepID=UPI003D31BB11